MGQIAQCQRVINHQHGATGNQAKGLTMSVATKMCQRVWCQGRKGSYWEKECSCPIYVDKMVQDRDMNGCALKRESTW